MAGHHEAGYVLTARKCSISCGIAGDKITMTDDEVASDIDEPPDDGIHFLRYSRQGNQAPQIGNDHANDANHQFRKPSLLTQALLKPPDSTQSDSEAPPLTSDGGMTSPPRTNTPSPPLPDSKETAVILTSAKDLATLTHLPSQNEVGNSKESSLEAGLGRPRCIKFACWGKKSSNPSDHISNNIETDNRQPADPPQRSCKLRFACPTRPPPSASREDMGNRKASLNRAKPAGPNTHPSTFSSVAPESRREHRDSVSTITNGYMSQALKVADDGQPCSRSSFGHRKLKRSEATRFHEFAPSYHVDDDWIQEQPTEEEKITVQDTLRKENLIRRLTDEVDEEALEDEVQERSDSYDNVDPFHLDDKELASEYESSDGGNETDDEEGFADSDDDSDHGSQYQFWTSGLTTAATSTEHVEHIRPMVHRLAFKSSIESMINTLEISGGPEDNKKRNRKTRHHPKAPRLRPGTPDLPDSTDFVCGTLDEDRPIEAAYMSCLEERRRSRHKVVPQDIDPSFPTSDSDEEDDDPATLASDEHIWVTGRLDKSDEDCSMSPRKGVSRARGKSPKPSPNRPRSPVPPRRGLIIRSPPPRCLFGRSPLHVRPRFMHQKLKSPPSTRRASMTLSPDGGDGYMIMSHLAQRPHLTHTTSLPRTPNPFWRQRRDSRVDGSDEASSIATSPKEGHDIYGRGPINIASGLANKRQSRKERLCRHHIRHTGKDKERRCQPGIGAERMRELGLEMAGKARGYCQRVEHVLSF